jgi:predicted RNA binding protein YcfA (HicA-like mRNA interferase family)
VAQIDKLILKLQSNPKDSAWDELKKFLLHFGFEEMPQKGKIGGSRRKFINKQKDVISLHEPHPKKIVQSYAIKQIIEHLNL